VSSQGHRRATGLQVSAARIILALLEDNEENAKAFFEVGAVDCILTLVRDNPDDEMISVISMMLIAGTIVKPSLLWLLICACVRGCAQKWCDHVCVSAVWMWTIVAVRVCYLIIINQSPTCLLEEYPPVYEQVHAGGTMELARKANDRHVRNIFFFSMPFSSCSWKLACPACLGK
jgi:hypothetical protein